jgi:hypothetical protein
MPICVRRLGAFADVLCGHSVSVFTSGAEATNQPHCGDASAPSRSDPRSTPCDHRLVTGELLIAAYDPAWPKLFAELAGRLRANVGEVAVRIDHIGSTAVPGLDAKPIIDVSAAELTDQLRHELTVSRRHLRAVLDGYWDRQWRREHNRFGGSPENDLWRAAVAVAEIQEALDELEA